MPSGSKVLIRTLRAHVYCSTAFPCVTDPQTHAMTSCMLRPLELPRNSGVEARRTGSNWLRQPPICDVRLRHGDKLCVERDTPLPRKRPARTTTVVVCTVCARSTPICFQATRSMESDNIARTRGHSLHDEHPWVKTVQAMAVLTQ